jgi:hypothetical protein
MGRRFKLFGNGGAMRSVLLVEIVKLPKKLVQN